MGKPLLVISAPVATRSGYGEHSRDIIASLLKMDKFDVRILNQRWGNTPMNALYDNVPLHQEIKKRLLVNANLPKQPDVWIQVTVPNEFQKVGKYNIGITAGIETTICAPEWLQGMNNMDLVIVPSKFSKDVFDATAYEMYDEKTKQKTGELKCNVPIEVIFEGADTTIYYDTKNILPSVRFELNKIKEDFAFLFVGHWLKGNIGHDRKDVGMLVKVFLETFKKETTPPALILKTSGATFSVMDREETLNKIEQIRATVQPHVIPATSSTPAKELPLPNVYLLHGELSADEMNAIYNHSKVKAHVSFTKGEGFGRPLLEASFSGKPMIVSNWSGHLDFLDKNYTLLIGGELKDIDASAVMEKMLIQGSKWFYINYNEAANAMYSVFKDYNGAKAMCLKQKDVSKIFSLNKMHDEFTRVFEKYLPKFPESTKLQLPKLKKIELPKKDANAEVPKV